jgi:hypothetical protein
MPQLSCQSLQRSQRRINWLIFGCICLLNIAIICMGIKGAQLHTAQTQSDNRVDVLTIENQAQAEHLNKLQLQLDALSKLVYKYYWK